MQGAGHPAGALWVWGGGALASRLPAPTPALLSSRFSAEQTRMVSVASAESHAGG